MTAPSVCIARAQIRLLSCLLVSSVSVVVNTTGVFVESVPGSNGDADVSSPGAWQGTRPRRVECATGLTSRGTPVEPESRQKSPRTVQKRNVRVSPVSMNRCSQRYWFQARKCYESPQKNRETPTTERCGYSLCLSLSEPRSVTVTCRDVE